METMTDFIFLGSKITVDRYFSHENKWCLLLGRKPRQHIKKQRHYVVDKGMSSQLSSVQLLSHVRLFATPWTPAHQASLSITNSRSPPKPMPTESVMPSNHLILCHPLLLLPSIFTRITVFSNESALQIRWPKYWSFSFSIGPSNEYQDWFPLGWAGWISFSPKFLLIKKLRKNKS